MKKEKPLCPPEKRPKYEDIVFAVVPAADGSSMELKLDIYQAPDQQEPGPCIIYYFGGGWMWGEYKQVTQKAVYCRDLVRLTEAGYTIVSPSYRLASQAVFPACIHDCKGVVRFLKANAEQYHIDPDRIGVLGNSAGGHLAGMVALSSGNPEMEGDVGGNLEYSSSVRAAAIFYAPSDLVQLIREASEKEEIKDLSGTEIENLASGDPSFGLEARIVGYSGPGRNLLRLSEVARKMDETDPDWKYIELAKKCSPVTYASPDCPPVIILHGGQDPVVPVSQSECLYKALTKAGAEAVYLSCSQAGHGPTVSAEADQFAYDFLKNHLN